MRILKKESGKIQEHCLLGLVSFSSRSLFPDFPQTQTLTFVDLGLNPIGKAGSPQPPPPMVASSLLQPKSLSLSPNLISLHRSNLKDHQLLWFESEKHQCLSLHPILSKPQPLLSLWSGSKKDACMGVGISGELRFFLCFCWWVWVEYARGGGWESLNFEIWERECLNGWWELRV